MKQDNTLVNQPFIPVLLGANIGVYSIARTFHEAYGVKSISVSRLLIGPIKYSTIIHPVLEPNMEQKKDLLTCLNKIKEDYPQIPKILIGSDDWHVEMIIDLKEQLSEEWVIPYTTSEVLHRVIDKTNFYNMCEELGVDYPRFISYEGTSPENLVLPFDFPVVIKPTSRVTYELVKFDGKKKVFIAKDREEFNHIISIIRGANYMDKLVVQEFVPGDDTSMHILTLYTTRNGETKLASFGQTLLENHTPGGLGNPVAIRSLRNDEVIEQAKRIVESVGYVGFSNFDIKYDERDGKYKFFELNPRLGQSNYYVTAEGHNAVEYYVKEYIKNEPLNYSVAENQSLYTIVPKRLLLKYIRDQKLQEKVKNLYKTHSVKNPMMYFPVEKSLRRLFYVIASTFNYYKKFKNYPPL